MQLTSTTQQPGVRGWGRQVRVWLLLLTPSRPTLLDPMGCSNSGFPVLHSELAQTHMHWVGDAIQPSHPLSSPSPLALNLSQHQGLFKWVSSSRQVTKVLELQLQHQSFQWIFRFGFSLGLTGLISLMSKGLSRVFSSTSSKASVLQSSAFFIVRLSYPYISAGKPIAFTRRSVLSNNVSAF